MKIFQKVLLFSLSLISSLHSTITLNPAAYEHDARAWVATLNGPHADLQIIANLLYVSYLRSQCTLESQDIATKALQTVWQGWQNIAQTRMNPSKSEPFQLSFAEEKKVLQKFLIAQEHHHKTCQLYANVTEHVLHEHAFEDTRSLQAVQELRTHAREVIVASFCDKKKIIAELASLAKDALTRDIITEEIPEYATRFDLLHSILDYIPQAALHSFIETEKLYTKASEHTWNALFTIQSINAQIWHAIEIERASYYLAHYNVLYTYMKRECPDLVYMAYDEHGIHKKGCLQPLPDLCKT